MRAAAIDGPGSIRVREVALPEIARGQACVRIEGCGVCGSNLALWQGRPWFNYPSEPGAPGHEGWGYVERVGADVPEHWVGQRVAMLSYKAFAEYDVADVKQLVPLPRELAGQPFPGEALGCAMNIYRRSEIKPGQSVAVIGAGFLGLLLVQLAARAGAKPIAISRRRFALELAAQAGASLTLTMPNDRQQAVAQVMEATHQQGCDVVIEAVGEQAPLDLAGELTKERGRLVIAGYHQDPRQVNMQLWNWRGLDVVNAHERAPEAYLQGMREAVQAVSSGALDPSALYTHSFKLRDLDQALNGLQERPDGMLKTWVTP
jgi:threonine dehydrogenase-like Zn-dependent dehydrogenase